MEVLLMGSLFGTDGIRGTANVYPMTPELALQVGRAVGYYFKKYNNKHHKILIGKDTRLSGYILENALTAGICSMGADVLLVHVLPTPAIAYLTTRFNADAGIVISASHNPAEDNGMKIFSKEGLKLPDDVEDELEKLILGDKLDEIRPVGIKLGKAFFIDDARGRYINFVKNTLDKMMDFSGLKIALDCANGAAYKVGPSVLEELDADVTVIGNKPDGLNINSQCGSTYLDILKSMIAKGDYDLGLAFDGDADRVLFIDEHGNDVDGDKIMAILATHMKEENQLNHNTLVATVMSNLGLDIAMKRNGINIVKTNVGDRYVVEEMLKHGYNLGGEQSGHIVLKDYNTTGDGLITALQLLQVLKKSEKSLSELAKVMERLPQVLINVEVKEKIPFEDIDEVQQAINQVEGKLKDKGRVLVRYSGTQNVARVMIEGENESEIGEMAEDIAQKIQNVCK
jgi:phosphoglucosamine mutase